MKRILIIITYIFTLATASTCREHADQSHQNQHKQGNTSSLVLAANEFILSLDQQQKDKVMFDFKEEERYNWHYIPRSRKGLSLESMDDGQKIKALKLLNLCLSERGYKKASNIMELEGVLGDIEGRNDYRNAKAYYFSIFGTPSDNDPWGWRVEGHHLSLNFSSVTNEIAVTPAFMGANPAIVPSGPKKGWQVLKEEQELGRKLVKMLDQEQQEIAIINKNAPGDIITGSDRKVKLNAIEGLSYQKMTADQQKELMKLLEVYIGKIEKSIADKLMADLQNEGIDKLHFAWAGSLDEGKGHYYRIHGPTILIEYDNTQNNANHVHSVWRDLKNDFGEDYLSNHYKEHSH